MKGLALVLIGNHMTESVFNMKPEFSDITKYLTPINIGYSSPKERWPNLLRYKRHYHNYWKYYVFMILEINEAYMRLF
jgi:hypothetical protein